MIGKNRAGQGQAGLSRLELMLLVALLAGGGVVAVLHFSGGSSAKEASEQGGMAGGADKAGAEKFSSKVLNEMAAEDVRFAKWAHNVAEGSETDSTWTVDGPALEGANSPEGSNSPEFIARSRLVPNPKSSPARAAGAGATGLDGAGAGDADVRAVAGATNVLSAAEQLKLAKQRAAARASSEASLAKTAQNISKMLQDVSQMEWSPKAEQMLNSALNQWAKLDPNAALNYALSLDSRRARVNAVNNVLSVWAHQDPTAAQSWFLQNMPQDPLAAAATVRQLYGGIGKENTRAALSSIWQLPTENLRVAAMQTVMGMVVRGGDASAVSSYFASLSDPAQKDYLAMAMSQTWATYQPEVAGDWLNKISDINMMKSAVPNFIATWSFDDPAGATHWASQLPDPGLRYSSVQQGTRTWAKDDPVAAADWVLTLGPPSPQADPAILGLIGVIKTAYPQGAMTWATSINDPTQRNAAMAQVGKVWLQQDPVAAAQFIRTSILPEQTKAALLGTAYVRPKPKK